MTYEEVLESVKKRDKLDSERELSPLKKADDAIVIDGTNLSISETEQMVRKIIEEKMRAKRKQQNQSVKPRKRSKTA